MLDALVGHSAVYSQTLEAGRHFYETATDSGHQTRLQTELQDLEKAWDKTQSGLERRCELVNTGVQVRFQISSETSHHQLLLDNPASHHVHVSHKIKVTFVFLS